MKNRRKEKKGKKKEKNMEGRKMKEGEDQERGKRKGNAIPQGKAKGNNQKLSFTMLVPMLKYILFLSYWWKLSFQSRWKF